MAGQAFLGRWEVINCAMLGQKKENIMERTNFQFHLDEDGGVTWFYPEVLQDIPLFCCDTYEIYTTKNKITEIYIRLGVVAGQVFEFRSDQFEPKDEVLLTCDSACILKCKRCTENQYRPTNKFSFLQALDEGYFSDLTIKAANNKEFKVHSIILSLLGTDIDWASHPPPFSGAPEDVLKIILHYLYSEYLPEQTSEESVQAVIEHASKYKSLGTLVNMCKIKLQNIVVKQQIIDLICNMHESMNHIIELFNQNGGEALASNPAKLCYVIKQSFRDVAVVGVNLLLVCNLFHKNKSTLPKSDRHDVIKYAKSRLPDFFGQLTSLITILNDIFNNMSVTQKNDIAAFLAPEISIILDKFSSLMTQVQYALRKVILKSVDTYRSSSSKRRGKYLRDQIDMCEIEKIRTFQEHLDRTLNLLNRKKTNYSEMTLEQKIKSISNDLDLLIEEIPVCLMRLDKDKAVFDEKLNWREFNFCFVVATSKIGSIMDKLESHRTFFQSILLEMSDIIKRESFNQSLRNLNMFVEEKDLNPDLYDFKDPYNTAIIKDSKSFDLHYSKLIQRYDEMYRSDHEEIGLFFHQQCSKQEPQKCDADKIISTPTLGDLSASLLNNLGDMDMEFEIVNMASNDDKSEEEHSQDVTKFKAHRVVIASRCDWFRRALLSGMREDIDKKIVVHDTNASTFNTFLQYLYTDKLNTTDLNSDQVIELLLLSDLYEMDNLKHTVEFIAQDYLVHSTAIYFTSIADQYNASILKHACFVYITQYESLLDSPEFFQLPISLQAELFDCILKPCAEPKYHEMSRDEITKLVMCLKQIRDIVGDYAPREALERIIVAADYDLCRAVNFYFARIV